MFFNLMRIKKTQPKNSELNRINEMLDQTWRLSHQFQEDPKSPEAIGIFNGFFKKLNIIVSQILKNVVGLASLAPTMFAFSQDFMEKTGKQEIKIADISKAGKTMAGQIEKIARNAQMVAKDSDEIQNEVRLAKTLGEQSMERFATIKTYVFDLVETIEVLDENSKSIGDIINVINEISDETNVLSLNARIEAARGNVDGKGFKVIAEEIASLAKQSKSATQNIQERLTILSEKVDKTVNAVKMVEENVTSGENLITDANNSLGKVHNHFGRLASNLSMIQDSTALQSEDVKQVSIDIQEIEASVKSQSKGVETIVQTARKINGICDQMILDAGIFHLSGHDTAKKCVEGIASDPDILSFIRQRQEQALQTFLKKNPFIELVYITDKNGRQVIDNLYADHVPEKETLDKGYDRDWSGKEWFKKPVETQETFVSKVYRSSATRQFCFTVAVPLFNAQSFAGVMGIDINFTDILEI